MKKIDKSVVITGVICLTIMEIVAMFLGINGTMRSIIFALIAAMVGIVIPTPKILRQNS